MLSGSRYVGRVFVRMFLILMVFVIIRDFVIFIKVVVVVCQLELFVGRIVVVLLKEKEKEKEKFKVFGVEFGLFFNDFIRIFETKVQDGLGKGFKGYKKIFVNFV